MVASASVQVSEEPGPGAGTRAGRGFSPREEQIVLALAKAAMPRGKVLPGGGPATLARLYEWMGDATPDRWRVMRGMLWSAELAAVASTGRPLSRLSEERAAHFLEGWSASRMPIRRAHLRAVMTPIKAAHFDDPTMFEHVGCPYGGEGEKVRLAEADRWMRQVTDGREVDEELTLECEVVVVGTGAGGAACAYELARRGRAVLLLEEGDYHRRDTFNARAAIMSKKLYRDQGLTIALGNVRAPVWAGRAVGGSTVINSGTCYRAPDRVIRRWHHDLGLPITPARMKPYFERVEAMLQVEPADFELTGGVGRVIARGAGKLGLAHGVLHRNAPGCDGRGVCCFGCPTGAKRSTDVSYVPGALERGAQLVTAARVDSIDVVAGRARGVGGVLGSGRRFKVKADAVVIAGGALMTPVILKKAGVCRNSRALGRNLTIHPASKVMALFDEAIDMASAIPQGYSVDHYQDEGMMFEGGSTPLDVTALAVPWVGTRFMEVMERYRHLATFGFMIADTSRGQVRVGPRGSPLITYDLNAHDTKRMQRGIAILCEIFLAAGAKRVLPMLPGAEEVHTHADLEALKKKRVVAGDIEVSAYHPLGTCRMGSDPETSVIGPDHETHETERLYVVDGSAVPTPLGVNPQVTIMAMALRAAEGIDSRLG